MTTKAVVIRELCPASERPASGWLDPNDWPTRFKRKRPPARVAYCSYCRQAVEAKEGYYVPHSLTRTVEVR